MSIQTELTRITNAKAAIKTAIEGKGVTVPDGTLLDGMATLIESVEAGGGATEPYVEETCDSDGNLTSAVMHGHLRIRNYAFYQCSSLPSMTIPDSVTTIGNYAFYGCRILTSVTIPDSVTTIGDYAFYNCRSLPSVTIPDSVTSIGDSAFYNCVSLTSVTIPNSVTTIGGSAFRGCGSLTSVTFNGTPSSIGSNAFNSCRNLTTINVPWAEGAVAGAPWGATNATINYNYTG